MNTPAPGINLISSRIIELVLYTKVPMEWERHIKGGQNLGRVLRAYEGGLERRYK